MSRSAHTYALDEVEVLLTVPEGVRVPRVLTLRSTSEGSDLAFEHVGVKAVRAPSKRKPRPSSKLAKIASDWAPPEHEIEAFRTKAPSVNIRHETEQFVDWALSKGEARADWLAAWRGWIRRTHKANVDKGWKPKPGARADESPRDRWCREHGVTVEEYEAKKGDAEWLDVIKRRGKVG